MRQSTAAASRLRAKVGSASSKTSPVTASTLMLPRFRLNAPATGFVLISSTMLLVQARMAILIPYAPGTMITLLRSWNRMIGMKSALILV